MIFEPETTPFPAWLGPYSPARGNRSGFRVKYGVLGAWVTTDYGQTFCAAERTAGTARLAELVRARWSGGRIEFLPGGIVVKPLQDESERGRRVVLGRYTGSFRLHTGARPIDFSATAGFVPGTEWQGPGSVGLECRIRPDGSLVSRWTHPSRFGEERHEALVFGPNPALFAAFRRVRRYDTGGRVRITLGGHVITSRETGYGWAPFYVGRVDPAQFRNSSTWLERR